MRGGWLRCVKRLFYLLHRLWSHNVRRRTRLAARLCDSRIIYGRLMLGKVIRLRNLILSNCFKDSAFSQHLTTNAENRLIGVRQSRHVQI